MLTEIQIKAKYKKLHDDLSEAYYSGESGLTKEEFDQQHGKVWSDMEAELIAGGFLTPPEPPLVFDPSSGTGTPKRLTYIEEFLAKLYPGEEV